MLGINEIVRLLGMASTWSILGLLVSSKTLVAQSMDNKYSTNNINPDEIIQTLCNTTSTHPKQFVVQNVCITKDYSVFNELNKRTRANLGLVVRNLKVVDVDEKKKEIALDMFAMFFWEDKRINAFFPPDTSLIDLPPMTPIYPSQIWSPFPKMAIPNVRNTKYLDDPVIASFELKTVELINKAFGNISFSGNFPIVQSMIRWSTTISCLFDFSNFPFDTNTCLFRLKFRNVDISLAFVKETFATLVRRSDVDGFKIEVRPIHTRNTSFSGMYFTDVDHYITLQRQAPKYFYQYYIPCITIVVASSFSFIIPLSAIPGRVALVVTQFLTLTNIFINQMASKSI